MNEKYLVINAGSSSLKFSLYDMPEGKEIVSGIVEKIGQEGSSYTFKVLGEKMPTCVKPVMNHTEAVQTMLDGLLDNGFIENISEIKGVGHRVLHGGEKYSESVLIDEDVLADIRELTKFGPLHHPGEIAGIEAMQNVLSGVPQVAVFDTAFHQTIPEENFRYAIPNGFYTKDAIRKYGFHGTSHKYITEKMQEILGKNSVNLIVCHIGSGASICCVKDSKSYDTTMGLTPLDGLVMGTRSGSIDPSIISHICKIRNLSVDEVIDILNKESGLFGLCGNSDWRDVCVQVEKGDANAILAVKLTENSIRNYIGQYYFELNGNVDAIVFTAGIGENSSSLRANVINSMSNVIGTKINDSENNIISRFKEKQIGAISTEDSRTLVYVVPTNEEYMILRDTYNVIKSKSDSKGVYHKEI